MFFYIFLENSVENRMFVNVITSGRTVNLRNYLHLLHRSSYTPLTRLTKQTNWQVWWEEITTATQGREIVSENSGLLFRPAKHNLRLWPSP